MLGARAQGTETNISAQVLMCSAMEHMCRCLTSINGCSGHVLSMRDIAKRGNRNMEAETSNPAQVLLCGAMEHIHVMFDIN